MLDMNYDDDTAEEYASIDDDAIKRQLRKQKEEKYRIKLQKAQEKQAHRRKISGYKKQIRTTRYGDTKGKAKKIGKKIRGYAREYSRSSKQRAKNSGISWGAKKEMFDFSSGSSKKNNKWNWKL